MPTTPLPTPTYLQAGLYRWNCVDGAVIADAITSDPGVHFYPKSDPDSPQRKLTESGHRIDDPLQLTAALQAAQTFLTSLGENAR